MDRADVPRLCDRLDAKLFDRSVPPCAITFFEAATYEGTGLVEAEVDASLAAIRLWSGLLAHPAWLREVLVLAMVRVATGDDFGGPRFVRELRRVADRGEAWADRITWGPPRAER